MNLLIDDLSSLVLTIDSSIPHTDVEYAEWRDKNHYKPRDTPLSRLLIGMVSSLWKYAYVIPV